MAMLLSSLLLPMGIRVPLLPGTVARHGAVVAQFMPNAGENPVFTFARNIKQMSDQRVGKAQHIMLKTTEQGGKTGTIEEAYAKIEDWKARAGTDAGKFAEIAIAESEDEQTAKDGGDLGVILRGRLPRQLEDAIYDAKAPDGGVPDKDGPNVLVGPVASNFGLHLILVQSCQEPKTETATLPDWMGGGKWERKKNPDAQD